ncbi:MAG TPA: gluconate 2-dehydrogenase subunit 3 family protein [Gemmatimonadaceae bacterium]
MTDHGRRTTDDGPQATGERDMDRRDVVKLLATASLAVVGLGAPEVAHAWELTNAALASQGTGTQFAPAFFTPVEWRAVRSLVDVVIPRDDRSGSATDAGVPEFMDFMMVENPKSQPWMRDGLKWLNDGCRKRFGREWTSCSAAQQRQLLNVIAFPNTAPATVKAGVEFFSRFRDLTSSGFWTSRMGVKDLGYKGNTPVPVWSGCPEPALTKLGVSYRMSMHVPKRG